MIHPHFIITDLFRSLFARRRVALVLMFLLLASGCDRAAAPVAGPTSREGEIRIASLVPAATDLILGMGAADHLAAVSNWETDRPEIKQLPHVGDYQTIDWEKLAEVRPDAMIVFIAVDRIPPGFSQRAEKLDIKLINVKTERLDDIFQTITDLGNLLKEPTKAADLASRMHAQLDAVKKRVEGLPPTPTLIARDEEGYALIAGDTFADDLLSIAGGKNVAGGMSMRYPNIDRERFVELAPQAIIQLLPGASPQVQDSAKRGWQKVPDVPAVKNGKVFILTDWFALQPGSHVGELAERMADVLHPR